MNKWERNADGSYTHPVYGTIRVGQFGSQKTYEVLEGGHWCPYGNLRTAKAVAEGQYS